MISNRFLFLAFLLLVNVLNLAQFRISQLNSNFDELNDSLFLGITESRSVQSLNSDWKVFFADDIQNFSRVSFPLTFNSEQTIIFEKKIEIDQNISRKNFIRLNFLGINYVAEIFLNNASIYTHPGGEIPFHIDLPENLIRYDSENIIKIKINYDIDSRNTIPLLQRFLFPPSKGGIFRDVYLSLKPRVGIKDINYTVENDTRPYTNRLNFNVILENFSSIVNDSLLENYDGRFKVEALLKTTSDTSRVYFNIWNINPINSENPSKEFYVRLRELYKWSSDVPISYIINIKLTNGDGFVFDEYQEKISLIDIHLKDKEIFINQNPFDFKGVTLIRNYFEGTDYNQLENDIIKVKEIGFNTIRFSKAYPHPYQVFLCNKYGLYTLIELPLNSVPERFSEDKNFENRSVSLLERTIDYYENYSNVLAYGVGGSYLAESESHINFISKLNSVVKSTSLNKLSYSSFIGLPEQNKITTDLFGVELYATELSKIENSLSELNSNDSILYFISEATYPTYKGATNGYLNDFSFEGQAKYYEEVISLSENSQLTGFFINSMFDYEGDFAPMFSGYNEENIYNIGIFSDKSDEPRLSYNLIKSKLKSGSNISVPIGNSSEDAPLIFIITALIISVIIALLINSKRKFREDTTRALLRPYNFYADIRDQRILSGFHSLSLMLLLAGSNALLVTILLYHFKNNILFNKIIISFGDYELSKFISYLAWNPNEALFYVYGATIAVFILVSILVHASSFFVKNRVLYSNVYSVLIWAFLPLALLLPVEAILYKILISQTFNYIAYAVLILFLIWNIQRFLKGIYVIFDVRPLFVYTYAFLAILLLLLSFGVYYQYSVSAFDYINLAIKQYINL